MGWLPLSENALMIRAAYAALNEQAFGELMRKASLNTVEHPLFRGALNFVLRAVGVKPKTLVKAIPAGWPLTWKDCGPLSFVNAQADVECAIDVAKRSVVFTVSW